MFNMFLISFCCTCAMCGSGPGSTSLLEILCVVEAVDFVVGFGVVLVEVVVVVDCKIQLKQRK